MTDSLTDLHAYQIEWDGKLSPTNAFGPVEDPLNATATRQQQFNAGVGLFIGTVVDTVANLHCYRVLVEQNKPPIMCVAGSQSSLLPMGTRDVGTITPGSLVVLMRHPQMRYGIILCVLPPLAISAQQCRSDEISQSSHCGLHVDTVHSKTLELAGVVNASAGRPLDSLPIGEAGWFADTGMRIWMDSFMAMLAADENCGVFAFYHDQMLRVAGHNLQEQSAGHVRETYNDRNELLSIHGEAAYPWEQLGVLQHGLSAFRELEPQKTQNDEPYYSKYEPNEDTQIPFHRLRTFGGYLGQGMKQLLSAPPDGEQYFKLDSETELPGLFEQQLTLSGHLGIRTAAGLTLAKRPNIPVPRQKVMPADSAADQNTEYRFSGLEGSGQEHKVKANIEKNKGQAVSDADHAAAGVMDMHSHLFNWEGAHAFHYHEKNWELPEESTSEKVNASAKPLEFSQLRSQMSLSPPDGINVKVDHRYGDMTVYPNYSYISLLDEGGIVIGDGYGSEIRMTGGNIYISAPGDVFLQPGRNVQLWGGKDVVVRAKNSIDLSASERDVRIKAEKNMQLVAGNGDYGGILLESKSATALQFEETGEDVVSGGIMFKCARGAVASWSKDVYLRTGGGDVENGTITLDAGQGQSTIITQSNAIINYVTTGIADYFSREGEILSTTIIAPTGMQVGGSLSVNGGIIAQGAILNRGGISTIGGGMAAETAVGRMRDQDVTKADEALTEAAAQLTNSEEEAADAYQNTFPNGYYAEGYLGNEEIIERIHFTFRSDEQYGAGFELFEARWQQLARLGGQELGTWEEKAVEDTWPYPGKQAMSEQDKFFTQDFSLFDVSTGNSKDRGSNLDAYQEPKFEEPQPTKLATGYKVLQ